MFFGLFYSSTSAYSSFSMPILSFMPILPLILHLMPIPTLPPPTPPPQFPTSPALSNPIPELILALLGSAMRPGSFWRRLVLLFVLVRLGTTWTCYSSWLILEMIRSVICPGRTWHYLNLLFVLAHPGDDSLCYLSWPDLALLYSVPRYRYYSTLHIRDNLSPTQSKCHSLLPPVIRNIDSPVFRIFDYPLYPG